MIGRAMIGCVLVLAIASCGAEGPSAKSHRHAPVNRSEGSVRLMKVTNPAFDRFTDRPRFFARFRARYARMLVYSPYFNDKTLRYPRAWLYSDLFAIYRKGGVDRGIARRHPDWILRDRSGTPLYINWGCANGTCPQYAGDFGNPDFQAWWITRARRALASGYRGLYIDDVDLDFRVSDGTGRPKIPIDPRSDAPMRLSDWRRGMTGFLRRIRRGIPRRTEIVHNAIWYAGRGSVAPALQQRSADVVEIEHGITDPGLTGGRGAFGLRQLLAYVDAVHRRGRSVILNTYTEGAQDREYNLAGYFLVSTGRDYVGTGSGSDPDSFWRGYRVRLGRARGRRYTWHGLLRRDFAHGRVLVDEPGADPVRVRLGRGFRRLDGRAARAVTVPAASGVVLVRSR